MRPTRLTTKLTAGLGFALVVGTCVLVAPAPARAGDGDDGDVPLDTKILRSVLEGIGLERDGAKKGIDYQERAPLVIPPGNTLPTPEKSGAMVANNPAWPKDPEIVRSKEAARRDRNRNVSDEREREQNPLRPSELTPGKKPNQPVRTSDGGYEAPASGFSNPLSPSELGYKGGLFGAMFDKKDETETARFTGEKPRASLTDPPPGYQTPSPDQPYGEAKAGPPKAENYYENHVELQK